MIDVHEAGLCSNVTGKRDQCRQQTNCHYEDAFYGHSDSSLGAEALSQLANFKAGDQVVLTWSGFDRYANAVNGAAKYMAGRPAESRFAFPVEFVSFDSSRGYVTFKAKVPASSIARIKSLRNGEWITAACGHGAQAYAEPIAEVRGFNELKPTS